MITKEEMINEFVKAINDGTAAIFAGAGLSRPSGFVNWRELLKTMANHIGLDINKEQDLVSIAQYYKNERGNKNTINQIIADAFNKDATENENIKILARLPISTYWTTNYDKLIEKSLEKINRKPDVKSITNQLTITVKDRSAIVYKMHGDVDNPADAVLTKEDYETYEQKRPLFRTALQADLISKTFLFIGFSFEDPNLEYILSQIRSLLGENQKVHYNFIKRICEKDLKNNESLQEAQKRQDLKIQDLKRYGLQTVYVNEYSEITNILKEIEKRVLLNNVFISGSAEEYGLWEENEAKAFLHTLAREIVANGNKIITGFGLGVGSTILNGALDEIYKNKYQHIDKYLTIRPFQQNISDIDEKKEKHTQYRKDMISQAGIAIFVFGNKKPEESKNTQIKEADGCYEEYKLALENKCIIIPIGSTGYMAEKISNEIENEIENHSYLKNYLDKLKNSRDKNELINIIIEIINNAKERINND